MPELNFENSVPKSYESQSCGSKNKEQPNEIFLVLEDEKMRNIYKEGLEKALIFIKNINEGAFEPRPLSAIICTESSGVPFGYAVKSALKEIQPKEELPKFLRINVKPFKNQINLIRQGVELRGEYREAQESFKRALSEWKEKIEKLNLKDKNVLILDEFTYSGNTASSVRYLLEQVGIPKEQIFSLPENITTSYPVWKYGNEPESQKGTNPTETKDDSGKVGIVSDKEKIRKAKNLISDMKLLGRRAAKALEQKSGKKPD